MAILVEKPGLHPASCLSNTAGSMYLAEVQIPFGVGGLGYTLNPDNPVDMGISVAVVNDLAGWLSSDPSTEAPPGQPSRTSRT